MESLGFCDLHVENLLLQEQLRTFPFQIPELVALRSGGVLMEEDEKREQEDERTNAHHEQNGTLIHHATETRTGRGGRECGDRIGHDDGEV